MSEETKTEEKIERVPFIESEVAQSQLNDEGLLTSAPTGFDNKLHLAPKSKDFASQDVWFDYQSEVLAMRAIDCQERSEKMKARAEEHRKYGDPATRALAKRRARLLEQLEKLDAELDGEEAA